MPTPLLMAIQTEADKAGFRESLANVDQWERRFQAALSSVADATDAAKAKFATMVPAGPELPKGTILDAGGQLFREMADAAKASGTAVDSSAASLARWGSTLSGAGGPLAKWTTETYDGIQRVLDVAKRFGPAIGAVVGLVAFKKLADMALHSAQAMDQVSRRMDVAGLSGKQMLGAIKESAEAFSAFGMDTETAAGMIGKFVQRTGDVAKAQQAMEVSIKLNRAGIMDTASAMRILGDTYSGNERLVRRSQYILERYNLTVDANRDAIEQLNETVQGSLDATEPYQKMMESISQYLSKSANAAGEAVLNIANMAAELAGFANEADKGSTAADRFRTAVRKMSGVPGAFLAFLGGGPAGLLKFNKEFGDAEARAAKYAEGMADATDAAAEAGRDALDSVAYASDGAAKGIKKVTGASDDLGESINSYQDGIEGLSFIDEREVPQEEAKANALKETIKNLSVYTTDELIAMQVKAQNALKGIVDPSVRSQLNDELVAIRATMKQQASGIAQDLARAQSEGVLEMSQQRSAMRMIYQDELSDLSTTAARRAEIGRTLAEADLLNQRDLLESRRANTAELLKMAEADPKIGQNKASLARKMAQIEDQITANEQQQIDLRLQAQQAYGQDVQRMLGELASFIEGEGATRMAAASVALVDAMKPKIDFSRSFADANVIISTSSKRSLAEIEVAQVQHASAVKNIERAKTMEHLRELRTQMQNEKLSLEDRARLAKQYQAKGAQAIQQNAQAQIKAIQDVQNAQDKAGDAQARLINAVGEQTGDLAEQYKDLDRIKVDFDLSPEKTMAINEQMKALLKTMQEQEKVSEGEKRFGVDIAQEQKVLGDESIRILREQAEAAEAAARAQKRESSSTAAQAASDAQEIAGAFGAAASTVQQAFAAAFAAVESGADSLLQSVAAKSEQFASSLADRVASKVLGKIQEEMSRGG